MEDEYEDEYYDEDEYEEGSGAVEEEEGPPEGQQEFLQVRERLKEQIRRRAQGAGASTAGRSSFSHDRRPPANFGSFFGPSKPVISKRVIEERKSMKELQNTVPRERRPPGKDIPSSSSKVQAKTNGFHQKQNFINEAKKKAEALKDNRDYSFLLSDDADIPSPKATPAARSALTQKSDRQLMHSAVKGRAPTSHPARLPNRNGLNSTSSALRHAESKRKEAFPNRERASSLDNGRMHGAVRNGSSLSTSKAAGQKFLSKGPTTSKPALKDVNEQSLRKNHLASKHLLSPNERPQPSQSQRLQLGSYGQRPQQSSQSQRPQQSSQSQRPQQSSHSQRPLQSSRPDRPQQLPQSQRPQQSLQRQRPQQSSQLQSSQSQRPQSQSYRPELLQRQRPLSSQGHYPEQRRVQANDRVKQVERQARPSSKPMPSRQASANGIRDDRAKKKQLAKRRFDDDFEDEEDPMAMIRSMFRYDPRKYAGRDDDDSDMEADFATIEMEEKRSAKIARQEDEEQLRLIEEEERREQERKRRRVGNGR
ncbi:protein SPT2 homolog [Brachypodium distachyon]|nr:protein SPT2 homolog [Brachypodium distachyon]XP_014755100.1 protein SPT2 homolog [Brachypodium distachyon]XP_014755101.1 protein SPT2 homolog [Brachypodium distachyon]KQK04910.1 hypothetical protein BRADI_2g16740v3 [Brachypodium distachyon]KQK04911.1 hypothetical protein BRADI_2g16740v3 [Brachypodium distachyon]KQK04912.1 hypothetical protein BRADI_2g16740v3 [Brachypodium distachyon]KQK04913.1 hypothetical protein BRADI_2g16740v3 [Brachypodium distachyon]|eukprot:XP_010233124.2 protein SPT2 homolog [Brachypodium distachyon]